MDSVRVVVQTVHDTLYRHDTVFVAKAFIYDSLAQSLSRINEGDGVFTPSNIIAAFSLFLSGLAFWVARNQNRNASMPFLFFQRSSRDADPIHGLLLQNKGPGPAIIQTWDVAIPNGLNSPRIHHDMRGGEAVPNAMGYAQMKSNFQGNFESVVLEKGYVIAPGEQIWIFRFPNRQAVNPTQSSKTSFLEGLSIRVSYKGIHGQNLEASLPAIPKGIPE